MAAKNGMAHRFARRPPTETYNNDSEHPRAGAPAREAPPGAAPPPGASERPAVEAVDGGTRLQVSWSAPADEGLPEPAAYAIELDDASETLYVDHPTGRLAGSPVAARPAPASARRAVLDGLPTGVCFRVTVLGAVSAAGGRARSPPSEPIELRPPAPAERGSAGGRPEAQA
ncbi:unnamed protein product, partial [Prorocentrum cordatum]